MIIYPCCNLSQCVLVKGAPGCIFCGNVPVSNQEIFQSAETRIFWNNQVNIITAVALALCVSKSSATMVLTMQENRLLSSMCEALNYYLCQLYHEIGYKIHIYIYVDILSISAPQRVKMIPAGINGLTHPPPFRPPFLSSPLSSSHPEVCPDIYGDQVNSRP